MTCLSGDYTISSSFSYVVRELEIFLLPADQTSRFGVEGELITMIDITFSSKMEHNSTTRRGEASTTGAIPINHICVGNGNNYDSRNGADDADNDEDDDDSII